VNRSVSLILSLQNQGHPSVLNTCVGLLTAQYSHEGQRHRCSRNTANAASGRRFGVGAALITTPTALSCVLLYAHNCELPLFAKGPQLRPICPGNQCRRDVTRPQGCPQSVRQPLTVRDGITSGKVVGAASRSLSGVRNPLNPTRAGLVPHRLWTTRTANFHIGSCAAGGPAGHPITPRYITTFAVSCFPMALC
jgi:hypothetical protein